MLERSGWQSRGAAPVYSSSEFRGSWGWCRRDGQGMRSRAGRGMLAACLLLLAEPARAGWPVSQGQAQSPGALRLLFFSTVNKNFCDPA